MCRRVAGEPVGGPGTFTRRDHSHATCRPAKMLERPNAPGNRKQPDHGEDDANHHLQKRRHQQHEYSQDEHNDSKQHVPVHASPPLRERTADSDERLMVSPYAARALLEV